MCPYKWIRRENIPVKQAISTMIAKIEGDGSRCRVFRGTTSPLESGPNRIAVITSGDHNDLYVNYHKLTTVLLPRNITFGRSQLGVIDRVGGDVDHPVEVVYTNAKVWVL